MWYEVWFLFVRRLYCSEGNRYVNNNYSILWYDIGVFRVDGVKRSREGGGVVI